MLKAIRHEQKKLKKTQINEKKSFAHGLEESVLLKGPFYPKQSTD